MSEQYPGREERENSDLSEQQTQPQWLVVAFSEEDWEYIKNYKHHNAELMRQDIEDELWGKPDYDAEHDPNLPEGWENWGKDPDTDPDAWDMPDSWYE